ncbi:MAG: 50S ribosomal protein L10 [Deltaproteobacteria bacterium]|nr:50S ribosomal protein L10 [Deltaproteobacteria bacterium]
MALKLETKKEIVETLKSQVTSAKAIIFAKNKGLKVSEVSSLRKTLAKEKSTMRVVQNRLLRRVLKEVGIEGLDKMIEGPTTMTASQTDPISPAKILVDFMKENEKLDLKGGYAFGQVLTAEKIKELSKIPSKEEMIAKILGCLQNPARSIVNVMAALPRSLVTVLSAIRDTKK